MVVVVTEITSVLSSNMDAPGLSCASTCRNCSRTVEQHEHSRPPDETVSWNYRLCLRSGGRTCCHCAGVCRAVPPSPCVMWMRRQPSHAPWLLISEGAGLDPVPLHAQQPSWA